MLQVFQNITYTNLPYLQTACILYIDCKINHAITLFLFIYLKNPPSVLPTIIKKLFEYINLY